MPAGEERTRRRSCGDRELGGGGGGGGGGSRAAYSVAKASDHGSFANPPVPHHQNLQRALHAHHPVSVRCISAGPMPAGVREGGGGRNHLKAGKGRRGIPGGRAAPHLEVFLEHASAPPPPPPPPPGLPCSAPPGHPPHPQPTLCRSKSLEALQGGRLSGLGGPPERHCAGRLRRGRAHDLGAARWGGGGGGRGAAVGETRPSHRLSLLI